MVEFNKGKLKNRLHKNISEELLKSHRNNIYRNENVLVDRRISNRVVQVGTRVTREFKDLLDKICYEEKLLLVELLEKAIAQYDKNRKK